MPRDQLPLQATLHFQPAPSHLAIPYLETLPLPEGICQPIDAVDLYARCSECTSELIDTPLAPNGNEPVRRFDLRQAITQMQLDRSAQSIRQNGEDSSKLSFRDVCRSLDIMSFADAHVSPRGWARMDVSLTWQVNDDCAEYRRSRRLIDMSPVLMTRWGSRRCRNQDSTIFDPRYPLTTGPATSRSSSSPSPVVQSRG